MATDGQLGTMLAHGRDAARERIATQRLAPRARPVPRVVAPYPASVRWLHWLTVALVLAAVALGFLRVEVVSHAWRLWLLDAHRTVGLLIFGVTVLRLLLRLGLPIAPTPLPRLVGWIARATHAALYLLLLGMPLLGVLMSNARSGSTRLFKALPLPVLMPENEGWADRLQGLHLVGGWILIGLVGLHASAALFHHYVLKDGVLGRMLPQARRMPRTT